METKEYIYGRLNNLTILQEYSGLITDTAKVTVNDNGINMIDSEVFNYVVEYLQIPEGVHTLMDKAFNSNNGLKHITFPSTLTNIGVQAFQFTNIEYVDLSNTNVEIIKMKTFLGCNVEVVKLPHCLTKIENSAFEHCTRLKYIHLHKTKLESIGEEAFFKCVNLTEITFPTSLSFIGKKAFVYTSIKSLYLDKTIIEEIPYQMCIGVKTLVDITYPITLRKINNGAFAKTSINQSLPIGVEYIGSESFYNCVNMQNLDFSSYTNLKTVYADSFINCGSETIILPNHITKFDMDITTQAILFTNTNHDYYRDIDFSNYKFLKKLFISAIYMHKIPDAILLKPGRLDDDEFTIMKTHAALGGEIIDKIIANVEDEKYIEIARQIARSHHERWDGNGYPDRIAGEDIPLCARIMAIADVFDALYQERCYKPPIRPISKVLGILEENSGTQFDPNLLEVFLELKDEIEEVSEG